MNYHAKKFTQLVILPIETCNRNSFEREREREGSAHLPTYKLRMINRSVKDGLNFNFFTRKVSIMSNTGIANICGFQRFG